MRFILFNSKRQLIVVLIDIIIFCIICFGTGYYIGTKHGITKGEKEGYKIGYNQCLKDNLYHERF